MNKEKQELLDKCLKLEQFDEIPILGGIYVVPTRYKHDSGYKIMYIIGYTSYKTNEEQKYYLIDTCCDVIDFVDWFNGESIKDLHIDITPGGIIHIWGNYQNMVNRFNLSSCMFEMIDKQKEPK